MINSVDHPLERVRLDTSLDGDDVLFSDAVARMGQAQRKLAIIREENEPFAVVVQASDWIKVRPLFGHEFPNDMPAFGVATRANVAWGLIQREVELAFLLDALAIDR